MVTHDDIRRLALALPEVIETSGGGDHISFEVAGGKGFIWTFMQRVHPKKPRVPDPTAVAVRCPIARREMLTEAAPDRFFNDDHYRGYPAILVRITQIEADEFAGLLPEAWRMSAPKALLGRLPG